MALGTTAGQAGLIDCGRKTIYKILGDLSFGIWVKFGSGTDLNDMIVIIERGAGESENENAIFDLFLVGSSNSWDIRYIHEYNSGVNELNTFNTNLNNNTWYHIAAVRDVSANTVKLYIDGALFGTFNYTNDPTNTSSDLDYGLYKRKSEGTQTMDDASFAEVVLSNVAWSEEEVKQLYAGRVPYRGLVHYMPLWNDGTDLSGNANNATLTTMSLRDHAPVGQYTPQIPLRMPITVTAGVTLSTAKPTVSAIIG